LVVGVYACSTAVIMVKACSVHPVLLAAYRQLLAAVVLAPVFLRDLRRNRGRYRLAHLRRTLLPGILLAAHFISWIFGARRTLAANASLIVNMVPIAMPFLLYLLVRERLNRGEWMGTAVALAGVAVLAGGDFNIAPVYFFGDLVCFVSMILYAGYLALGRRNRDFPTIWLYVVPLYFVGGTACLATSLFLVSPLAIDSTKDVLLTVGLAVIPTVIGHSIMNFSMKHFRGQVVGITNLSQFIFAAVMAFFLLGETPQRVFYVACVLVVAGVVLALRSAPRQGPEQQIGTPSM